MKIAVLSGRGGTGKICQAQTLPLFPKFLFLRPDSAAQIQKIKIFTKICVYKLSENRYEKMQSLRECGVSVNLTLLSLRQI